MRLLGGAAEDDHAYDDHGDDHGDGHGDGHALTPIFELRPKNLAFAPTVLSVGICIALTIACEFTLEHLEHRASAFYRQILDKVYKELTILGVISFTLFILEEEHVVEHGSMLLSFHFVHLAVFFLGGIFICQAVVAAIATYGIRNMWLRTGLIQLDALERSMHAYDRTWLGRRGDALRRLGFNFTRLRQQLEFHVFKSFFIGTYKLPATFRYSRYCVHNLKETFLRTIDHGVLGWACLLLFVALDWLAARAGTFGKKNNRNGGLLIWSSPRGFAVVGYVLLGLESAIVAVLQLSLIHI